jgi:TolB protein
MFEGMASKHGSSSDCAIARRLVVLVAALTASVLVTGGVTSAAGESGRPAGRLAIVSGGGLLVIGARTGAKREVATVVVSAPAWSPNGRELAYVAAGVYTGHSSLRSKSISSGKDRMISRLGGALSTGPAWSPRGDRVAFALDAAVDGSNHVDVVDRDGRHRHVVERDAAAFQVPQWSPDGTRIAYLRDSGGAGATIWVVRARGGDRHAVREGVLDYPESVSWSPDGKRIAFVGSRGEGAAVMTMLANGARPRSVAAVHTTSDEAAVGNVRWSPGSGRIAFVRWTADAYGQRAASQLCLADARGGGERVLVRAQYIDELAWSPDGRWLAYLTEDRATGPMRVWLVRADGSSNHRLARVGEEASGLDWGRSPPASARARGYGRG